MFLLGVILSLNFVACSDDEDKVVHVYSDEYLQLKVNGESITSKTIALEVISETEGVVVLYSIVPDAVQQTMYVTLTTRNDNKKIEGKLVQEFYEVELDGTITDDVSTADVTYTNTSALVGEWDYSDSYIRIEAKNEIIIDKEGTVVPAEMLEEQLKQILTHYMQMLVTLDLTSGGDMNVTYLSPENKEHTLNKLFKYYTTKERVFFIPDFSFLVTGKANSKADLSLNEFIYFEYKLINNELTFYIDKDTLLVLQPVIRVLKAFFEDTPTVIKSMESILTIASQSEVFEVGITLKR
ncbi:MAG: hypothetical protein LUH15_04980 [Tannerellaceae bacterium]|nr:hypothetical protein [Tannerellaceae bacterium]